MKKLIIAISVLSILLSPLSAFAQEASGKAVEIPASPRPVQVLEQGSINLNLQEAANVDWSTGKGRKDGILKWAVEDNYLLKTPGMLLRGTSNTAFGWFEIFTHPVRWSKNAPVGIGTFMGLIMGPIMAGLRTASGALDIATCWVPFWHGLPMPKPALGLRDVHHYGAIEDVNQYNHDVRRYGFNKLSDEY